MSIELRIPEVGESVTEAQIARWRKAEGEHVDKDEPLVDLETDKATLELPSPVSGKVTGPLKAVGETAGIGEVIGYIDDGQEQGKPAKASVVKTVGTKAGSSEKVNAVRRATSKVKSTGDGKRAPTVGEQTPAGSSDRAEVAEARVESEKMVDAEPQAGKAAETTASQPERVGEGNGETGIPEVAAAGNGREEEIVPMTPMRRRIAQRLVEAQHNAALLTSFNEVDMTALMSLRKQFQEVFQAKYRIKLGLMSFFVKAAIDALKQFPALNARIKGTDIIYRNYYDIGIAISTDRGLVAPILRDAQRLSFAEIELAIADFAVRARDNHLRVEELQGGTFTISNGGVFGSMLSTPIINPPQSGVLGMHAIQERPVARNGQVVVRPMMYLALTYDHRIVDGREAIMFLKRIIEGIEEPARMLLEV